MSGYSNALVVQSDWVEAHRDDPNVRLIEIEGESPSEARGAVPSKEIICYCRLSHRAALVCFALIELRNGEAQWACPLRSELFGVCLYADSVILRHSSLPAPADSIAHIDFVSA
jgi:hypothetical protein